MTATGPDSGATTSPRAFLNGLVLELFRRTTLPPAERPARLGKLLVVESAEAAETIFNGHELFAKNFALVAAIGESRFNLNGPRWTAFRARTQPRYARAGRPAMRPALAAIYREEMEAVDPASPATLEAAFARAALRVFFLAFDLAPDVAPFLAHFADLRQAALRLQHRSWVAARDTDPGNAALLSEVGEVVLDYWETCQQSNGVAALITDLAGDAAPEAVYPALTDFMTNMFAGIETTTAALAWTTERLGKNAEAQDRVRRDAALPADQAAGYLPAFLHETMRCFPPIPFVLREVTAPTELDGHRLAAGDQILVSVVGLHRDPGAWEAPNEFRAARPEFLAGAPTPPGFRPFLAGPRVCGGRRLAELEMIEALSLLLERFEIANPADTTDFAYALALRPVLPPGLTLARR